MRLELQYHTPRTTDRGSAPCSIAAIKQWRPWKHSTGPKSEEGKARVSRNAYKGGTRPILRELARLLREQGEALKRIG
jgi:hypothetical protein